MVNDVLFENVTSQVRDVCFNLNVSCSFIHDSSSIYVFGRLNGNGRQIVTATVIKSVSSIPNVIFNNVGIDSDGCLYALFFINEETDGNTD